MLELRTRTGRPHWLIIDEAHHLLPRERADAELTVPHGMKGVLMITVHPEHVSAETLGSVDVVVAIGKTPRQALTSFAAAQHLSAPDVEPEDLPTGEGLAWRPASGGDPVRFHGVIPREERRRHRRKYAEGELPPDRSFYFRGPTGALNLRAQNLKLFLQIADGVDQATWRHHLESGDVSRWLRDAIKDPELAEHVTALAAERLPADDARRRVRALIEARYTDAP
jgi:hypothetical protein